MLEFRGGTVFPCKIVFPKTDASGQAVVTKAEFLGQFSDRLEVGHGGSVNDLFSIATVMFYYPAVLIDDRDAVLSMPLLGHEKTQWVTRQEWFDYHTSCRNLEFWAGDSSVNLALTSTVTLSVEPRAVPT